MTKTKSTKSAGEGTGRRPRWKTALEIGAIVAFFLLVRAWQTGGAASGASPALEARDLEGAALRIGGERESPMVLHFFASWCGVCQAEEGSVASLAGDHEVIGVATQSGGEGEVRRYVREHGLEALRVVPDPDAALAARYGVRAFPTTFWIDRRGEIRHVEVGYTTELGMRLRAFLSAL